MDNNKETLLLSQLGQRIETLRKLKGLNQVDLGIDERTVRRIENESDNYNPSFLTLTKICEALEIDLSELFAEGFYS